MTAYLSPSDVGAASMGRLVVMSGYPAAGKSTLARALAAQPLGVGKLVLVDTTKTVDLEEVAAAMMRGFG